MLSLLPCAHLGNVSDLTEPGSFGRSFYKEPHRIFQRTQYKQGFVRLCFLPQGFRASPRHIRRRAAAAAAARLEEAKTVVEAHHPSEQDSSARKRRIKKNSRVQPEFYHSVQGGATRRPVSREPSFIRMLTLHCHMVWSASYFKKQFIRLTLNN